MHDLAAVHHVALTVRDCERSARWYTAVLGFEELFREDGEHRRARILRFAAGGYSVGLVQHLPADGAAFDPRRTGLDHLAFTVASRQELDGWAQRLRDHDVDHAGVVDIPTGAILNFTDPDGIALALFWDSPPT